MKKKQRIWLRIKAYSARNIYDSLTLQMDQNWNFIKNTIQSNQN